MVRDRLWKIDANGREHPIDSLLLAFIRGECPAYEKHIQVHLIECEQCSLTFASLSQTSNMLSQLKYMSREYRNPQVKPEQVLAHARRGVPLRNAWTGRRRQSNQKRALRLLNIPAAAGLVLIFIVVLAYASVTSHFSHLMTSRNVHPPKSTGTGMTPQALSPTPSIQVTVSPTPSANATKTVTSNQSQPDIWICATSANSNRHLTLCGSGFKNGHRVMLVVIVHGNQQHTVQLHINEGGFQVSIARFISSCGNQQISMFVIDLTSTPHVRSNVLTNHDIPGCSASTPTPGRFSSKSGKKR